MNRSTRKVLNGLLADALRAQGMPRNGATWAQAVSLRDALMGEGVRAKSACNKAAWRVMRASQGAPVGTPVVEAAPVAQAPLTDAERIFAQV